MKKKLIILTTVIGILSISLTVYQKTYARYSSNSLWNYYLKSQDFYFESDTLSESGSTYNNTNWDYTEVHFNLRNNLNNNLITKTDIDYTVKCSVQDNPNLTCKVNDLDTFKGVLSSSMSCVNNKGDGVDVSSFNKTDCELKGYTYSSIPTKSDLSFSIVSNNESSPIKDVVVKLEATSNTPYKKTLSATYNLFGITNTKGEIRKTYKTYDDYSRLIVSNTNDQDKCVSISFNNATKRVLLQDDMNVLNVKNNYVDSFKVMIPKNSSKDFTFYDINDKIDDFSIIELTSCK